MKKSTLQLIQMMFLLSCFILFFHLNISGQRLGEEKATRMQGESTLAPKKTGYLYYSNNTDRVIENLHSDGNVWGPPGSDELPPNATITKVELWLLVTDNGDVSNFYPADYEIYVSTTSTEKCVYNNKGVGSSHTDKGFDDDSEDDADITISSRDYHYFDGESANQIYGFRIVDNQSPGEGKIRSVALKVSWEAPSPNLDANYTPAGWSAPLVVDYSGAGTDEAVLYAGKTTVVNTSYKNWDYDIPDDCSFIYKITVDDPKYALYNSKSGEAANYVLLSSTIFGSGFTAGQHTFCQEVDPGDKIWWESDETDNKFCRTYTFVGPPVAPALQSPAYEATCQSTSLTLSWSSSAYATEYTLQLDDNAEFSSPKSGTVSATSKLVTGLDANTKYYWRVRGENPAGVGSYSITRSFITAPAAPATPSLSSPESGASCQPVSLTLDWNSATGASNYLLQVDNNSDFPSPVVNKDNLTASEYNVSGLSAGTKYYWRVRADNSCNESDWSSARNFTTGGTPIAPTLSGPSNSATCQATSLTLSWNSVSAASSYDVKVDNDNDFSSPVVSQTDISTTSASVSGLSAGTTYYWAVRSKNNCDKYSSWSDSRSFSTAGSTPAAPVPSSPSAGATCQPLSLILEWGAVDGAGTYTLQVDDNSDFSSPLINQGSLASVSKDVSGLSEGTVYYWRIKATNGCEVEGSWSPGNSFTTLISSVGKPALTGPADNARCQPADPTLSWESLPNATGYSLQVDNNADFSSPEYNQSCTGNSHNCSGLSARIKYYWRVSASGGCSGTDSWSDARSFETGSGGLSSPSLNAPADNSTSQPTALSLSWNAVTDAASYSFQLDDNGDFSSPLYDEELTSTSKEVSGLTGDTAYYWHIRANGECSSSDWSEKWKFETVVVTAALAGMENNGYKLKQNYPNPFTETTIIEFSIPVSDLVCIEFFDLRGRIIGSYSGHYPAGMHSMEITPDDEIQAGIYFYRMRTSEFVETKRCIFK